MNNETSKISEPMAENPLLSAGLNQNLFNALENTFGVIATQDEMSDIISAVKKDTPACEHEATISDDRKYWVCKFCNERLSA